MRTPPARPFPDHLKRYLDQVDRVPILTTAQNRELSQQVQTGLIEWKKHETNQVFDEKALKEAADAYNWLMLANALLVVSVAKEMETLDAPLWDRIQMGNGALGGGLPRAIELFNPEKAELSTYATPWIQSAIRRGVRNTEMMNPISARLSEKTVEYSTAIDAFYSEKGRHPTFEEQQDMMGWLTEEKLEIIRTFGYNPSSLDAPIRNDELDKRTLADSIPAAGDAYHSYTEKLEVYERYSKLIKGAGLALHQEVMAILCNDIDLDADTANIFRPEAWSFAVQIRQRPEGSHDRDIGSLSYSTISEILGITIQAVQQAKEETLIKLGMYPNDQDEDIPPNPAQTSLLF